MPFHNRHKKYPKAEPAGMGSGQRKVGSDGTGGGGGTKQLQGRRKANIDASASQRRRPGKIVGRRVAGYKREVSVGLVRRRRRTDIRYISKAVVEGRLDKTVGGRRRARRRHTVVRSSYHFSFAGNSTHAKSVAFNKLNNIKFNDATTFVNDVRGAISKIRATGLNMDSECLSLLILQNLPRNYDSLVRIISQMEPIPHEEEVLKKLEKDQLQFNNKDKNVEALYVKKPYKKKFKKFNKFNREKRIKYHNCNKLGHLAKDCWSGNKEKKPNDKFHYNKKANVASHEDEYETEVTSLMANKEIINDNMVIDKETDNFKRSPEPSDKDQLEEENMNLIDYG
ncbi:hypothetical protein PPACK8108_LOCUS22819 [Phakopsora pachyrhizi]|uniref:CCHC-type domain-containing protein n=1 Tax=Phakopsora pachyrhizi TaxID=170000 RepID=A0AAV0BMS9_PHAPC|nr:hypothetical protein PPACK8108_LOCUS22819 [Phakopsora pachyrhizi]